MENSNLGSLSQLPSEMLSFTLRHLESRTGSRLGQILMQGRPPIDTPHYVAPTSRGIVPHLSHDVLQKHTRVLAAHVALEDCKAPSQSLQNAFDSGLPPGLETYWLVIEKSVQGAPLFKTPVCEVESPLRQYIALPESILLIFGPRRVPPIPCPAQNTNTAISLSTSVGFRFLNAEDYSDACKYLKPDISVGLVDLVASDRMSVKRMEKITDRTHTWLRDRVGPDDEASSSSALFASIPPLEREQQSFYLADLTDEFKPRISGLSLYSPSSVAAVPECLEALPRLCLSDPMSPHEILQAVSMGVDLVTAPLVTHNSEFGIAFSFVFPPNSTTTPEPLAIDLWSTSHATSLESLTPGCTCYTCTRHHRAYIHHLLQAKEMLGWTLLQIHNFAVLDAFFANVRKSIADGKFVEHRDLFSRAYEVEMLGHTGQGPRIRGYQMKSVGGGEPKKNPKAYGRLDEHLQNDIAGKTIRPEAAAIVNGDVNGGFPVRD